MKKIFTLILLSSLLFGCTKKYGCGGITSSLAKPFKTSLIAKTNIYNGSGKVIKSKDGTTTYIQIKKLINLNSNSDAKHNYILAYGKFSNNLQNYIGKNINFQCKYNYYIYETGDEMLQVVDGYVLNAIDTSKIITQYFTKTNN